MILLRDARATTAGILRTPMSLRLLALDVSLAAAALSLGLAALASCGSDRACLRANGRSECPSAAEAQRYFQSGCGGVAHVDSPGELTNDDLCCYDVTNNDLGSGDIACASPSNGPAGPLAVSATGPTTATGPGACEAATSNCDACVACAEGGVCSSQQLACESNPSCATLRKCVEGCPSGDQNCVQTCIDGHQQGVDALNALYKCLFCQECFTICGGASLHCPM